MKKLLLLTLCAPLLLLGGCSDYDDRPLQERVDGLESRIEQLEELCKQMNTNIASLQALVETLRNNDTIVSVIPVTKDGKEIGYTITFTKSPAITIYHGEDGIDGEDGATPTIGVALFEGVYYWTVNGLWLTGPDGEKIRAEAEDGIGGSGKDGITPQLKIENDYWWVSTDEGATWTQLGKATGEDGKDGEDGDSFFQSVTQDDAKVTFTLADGTVIEIPKAQRLTITLTTDECALTDGTPAEVGYTITGATAETKVEVLSEGVVKAKVIPASATEGVISIRTDESEAIDEYTKVLVFAADGLRSAIAAITFDCGVLRVTTAYDADAAGGSLTVPVETNLDYEVSIEEAARPWLSKVDTRAIRTDNLVFEVAPNTGAARSGLITLTAGAIVEKICIAQKSGLSTYEITIPTDFTEGYVQKAVYNDTQIAEICLEYIRTGETDAQMTVVYPMTDGKADLSKGVETTTGGSVVWDAQTNTCTYTPGSAASAVNKIYLEPDGTLAVTTAETAPVAATVSPDMLIDVRGSSSETYKIVKIGTQYWMAENLRAERYADGSQIATEWSDTGGAYIYLYNSSADYKSIFGALYSGYAVQNAAGLAPAGWLIPDNSVWSKLKSYIGASGAGTKLKSKDYWKENKGTNITGLDLRPALSYSTATGFLDTATETWLWSNTATVDFKQPALHYVRITDRGTGMTFTDELTVHVLGFGHSIRCIKK